MVWRRRFVVLMVWLTAYALMGCGAPPPTNEETDAAKAAVKSECRFMEALAGFLNPPMSDDDGRPFPYEDFNMRFNPEHQGPAAYEPGEYDPSQSTALCIGGWAEGGDFANPHYVIAVYLFDGAPSRSCDAQMVFTTDGAGTPSGAYGTTHMLWHTGEESLAAALEAQWGQYRQALDGTTVC